MSIPLLEYAPLSGNHRVEGFEIPGDEQPKIYTTDNLLGAAEMDMLILASYRQVYNEQQMLESHRQRFLESQLRAGQITVRDFIRGLVISDSFRRLTYDSNNNYRFAEICIQRLLGRNVYSDREKLAWSIVLATKGLLGFIDDLLNSEEYLSNFGYDTVPYQRRRILPQRTQGELPFARMARYGVEYRNQLPVPFYPIRSLPTGLFDQFEQFTVYKFVNRANWTNTFTTIALLMVLITLLIFFYEMNNLIWG
ncbi:phycobilisome rod-core linker polypeptide [Tolypothrix sp. FACHB-123]|uniref:phycobilisome rod-core linker polypeptide n=1 Tax=Tolypothrix sp. FACHB-123 TaxID=2692868 RepID=UPI001684951F|nr:phycobilisome rod-core linker polypeptide [Tolypothrix sp. FACHB-123]MBD2356238.1 phycobilisome rod-core linker polypeptide [Tolypothrix sp. FACHB-123]